MAGSKHYPVATPDADTRAKRQAQLQKENAERSEAEKREAAKKENAAQFNATSSTDQFVGHHPQDELVRPHQEKKNKK